MHPAARGTVNKYKRWKTGIPRHYIVQVVAIDSRIDRS